MHIQLIRNFDGFAMLRSEWNELLSRSSADTVFLTWEWLSSWWESYAQPDDRLHIITVRDNANQLVGIVPLYRRVRSWLPLKPVRTLHFIGDGSADSDYLDSILVEGREEQIFTLVWNWLCSDRSSWDVLQLAGIPETSATCNWLKQIAEEREVISRNERIPCLITDLPPSWEDYLVSLTPRFRTKIRSTLREIAKNHRVRFYTAVADMDLGKGLGTLYDLHEKRWRSTGAEGVFVNPAKRRFYERFTALFLSQGWLAFDFLELDGRDVACQMCFRYRGTQFLLQEGFDPQFASESVGVALRALALKKAIEDGIRHYDFLAGLGRHKTQWHARLKHCQTTSLGPKSIQNTIYLKLPIFMGALRDRVKSIVPASVIEMRRRLAAS